MKTKKGTSQAIWIVIGLVVALVVAIVLITVFSGTTGKVQENTDPTVETGGNALSATACRLLCESCQLSGDPDCYAEKSQGRCTGIDCI